MHVCPAAANADAAAGPANADAGPADADAGPADADADPADASHRKRPTFSDRCKSANCT